ncbi:MULTISPECIES: DUF4345 domain-containing protein [Streptomyces]|uniref:DUF4345 domain-containing protein n=1 Tax=Streptomyces TaxID=1883 RepID=UPI00093EB298|nr:MULTISPECIES: DUF4345 domain-containing protein [unclassified Streptomyces]OKJ14918.1 hypothetical protein AMK20_03800 [Streptomyces sp. TSRI0261]QNQ34877.1 DUF4345 domain-containing protein [Streptomyces sp. CB00271]
MARALRMFAWLMGVACVAIGLFHVIGGNAAIPGESDAGATLDSLGRFFGAIFVGYGLVWLWAARQAPVPARVIRWLAAVFLLGGIGRILSLAAHGWPHPFQVALAVIELVFPPVWFWLADADERASAERAQDMPPHRRPGNRKPQVTGT